MRLTATDLAQHRALGIDSAMLERQHVRRVDDLEARDILGLNGRPGDLRGVLYPYLWPGCSRPLTHRLRRDRPEFENGKPKNKYLSAYGDRRHLYLACADPAWLSDPRIPIIAVEAEKSVLSVTCAAARIGRRVFAIGLGGCWGWRGRIGKVETPNGERADEVGPIADLDRITWTGRDVVLAFDANAASNAKVRSARRAFAADRRKRGAHVRILELPVEPGINGPDDAIGKHGDAALFSRVDMAHPEDFVRDNKDRIVAKSLDNIRLALARLDTTITYNAFAREVQMDGVAADDDAVDLLWLAIDDTFHFRPSKEVLRTVIRGEAHASSVHPVRAYLDSVVWDGTPRLHTWLINYGGAPDSPYARAVGTLPLIAAVRRIRHPGCKFDELLILESGAR
jgi:hypothetical protein